MIDGIPNINNNCYASAVIQCLRSVGIDIDIDMRKLTGSFEDAFEFYMYLVEFLPDNIKRKLTVETVNGEVSQHILLDKDLRLINEKLLSFGNIICAHTLSLQRSPKDVANLSVSTKYREYDYILASCVCYDFERNHYYALVRNRGKWYICDDNHIAPIDNITHNINLLFYYIYIS